MTPVVEDMVEPRAEGPSASAPMPPVEPVLPLRPSLRERAINSSAWSMGGYVAQQVLKFLSTLILFRLLAPDVYGVMTMIGVLLQGLQMFSDIGIGPGIIANKRGDQEEYLNTAFTIQVIRGFCLWFAACALAWPWALFYREHQLLWLIPVVSFTAVLSGFNSTAVVALNRQLRLGRLTLIGIGEQIVNYIVIILWAWYIGPTVWALIAGTLVSHLFFTIISHFIVPGFKARFHWNHEDARWMFRFGRWVFLSTLLTFLAMRADALLVGRLLGASTLGVYGAATNFSMLPIQLIKRIASQVALPALAEVARERPERFYAVLRKTRVLMIGAGLLPLLPMIFAGQWIIDVIYPDKWADAGWILQILALGALGGLLNSSYGSALWARGQSHVVTILLAIHVTLLVSGSLVAYHFWGERGFVIAVACVEWLNYPFNALVMSRHHVWQPEVDFPVIGLSAVAFGLTLFL